MTETNERAVHALADLKDWNGLLYFCTKIQEYMLGSILNRKYSIEDGHSHTLIRSMSSRLKSAESIQSKLEGMGLDPTPSKALECLHDLIGFRLICSYMDDIPEIIEELRTIPHFEILEIKDYIRHPKPSGYRSLHLIGRCTAFDPPVLCEIQLRTTAMDSWAALEHQMRYKKDLPESDYVNQELLACASLLYESDVKMQNVHRFLKQQGLTVDEESF